MRETYYIPEEETLVNRCLDGDEQAQYELYQKYGQAMYHVAVRMVPYSEDAEDIVQEVFVKVFRKLDSFQGQSSLGAWIKKITVNTALNFIRKHKNKQTTSFEDSLDIPVLEDDLDTAAYSMEQIHYAIKQLPERCRVVLSLFLIEGYQHQEIASILGVTVSTSKTQYRRGRMLLQDLLKG